jgi:hypothetical protein
MATRTLESSPHILPLYLRAAAPMIPGASLLPFVPGRGKEIPDLDLTLPGVRPEPDAVAAYAKVCGFALRDHLPPTYAHVLAFPLHMAVMADGSFPFGAVGLVHIQNRIVQHRHIGLDEELKLHVRPTKLEPHPRGRTFTLLTEAWIGRQKVWEEVSTMLRRGGGSKPSPAQAGNAGGKQHAHHVSVPLAPKVDAGRESDLETAAELAPTAEWRLSGDVGRRYAGVSGDRNPIHMHSLTAKPFGFPAAIAHGMWTKARCLAALESRLPDAFVVDVRFRKPILLPGRVELSTATQGEEIRFAVRDAKRHAPHLDGAVRPVEAKQRSGRKAK